MPPCETKNAAREPSLRFIVPYFICQHEPIKLPVPRRSGFLLAARASPLLFDPRWHTTLPDLPRHESDISDAAQNSVRRPSEAAVPHLLCRPSRSTAAHGADISATRDLVAGRKQARCHTPARRWGHGARQLDDIWTEDAPRDAGPVQPQYVDLRPDPPNGVSANLSVQTVVMTRERRPKRHRAACNHSSGRFPNTTPPRYT